MGSNTQVERKRPAPDAMGAPFSEIIWLAYTPTPYNNFLFEKLRERFGEQFRLFFASAGVPDAPWTSLTQSPWMQVQHPTLGIDWRLVREVLRRRRAMVVVSGWNIPTHRVLLRLLRFSAPRCVLWTDTPHNDGTLKHRVRNVLLRTIFRRAYAIMGTGMPAVRRLREMGAPANLLVNFPCWTPLPAAADIEQKWKTRPFRFGCIGRLLALKGFELAIYALAKLPDTTAQLDIIGTGRELWSLQDLAAALNVTPRVHFRGWQEPDAVARYLRDECHCLLHPATGPENWGVVIQEAMMYGTPVIGSVNSAAVVERVRDRVSGFVLDSPVSLASLTEAMRSLSDMEVAHRFGAAARATAEEWPVERGVDIIASLFAGRREAVGAIPQG